MPNWDLDPALFLTPRFQAQAPAEEIACVICANLAGDDHPDTVCVVDVNPTSSTYGDIVDEIALGQGDAPSSIISRTEDDFAGALHDDISLGFDHGHPITPGVLLAHDSLCPYGFVRSGFSFHHLKTAVSLWRRIDGSHAAAPLTLRQVITIPDEPERAEILPTLLQSSSAVPPLITDIALSPDDCFLYVACWGTGELKQFDVSNPLLPREIASVRIGGIAARAPHPSRIRRLDGGPATVTVSRDGRRIYLTNALSRSWEEQLYPAGLQGWVVKLDADPGGDIAFDPNFFVDLGDLRPLQVRLPDWGLGSR